MASVVNMQVELLKSKIHRAQVTGAHVDYEGSLTIASDLMDKAGLYPYEKILCSNLANGQRFETYAIAGTKATPFSRNAAFEPGSLEVEVF